VRQSPPTTKPFTADTPEPVPKSEQAVERGLDRGGSSSRGFQNRPRDAEERQLTCELSFAFAYDLWLASWETALGALATATQSRMMSTSEAAAHKTVIVAERDCVTTQFRLLLGYERPRLQGSHDIPITTADDPFSAP